MGGASLIVKSKFYTKYPYMGGIFAIKILLLCAFYSKAKTIDTIYTQID